MLLQHLFESDKKNPEVPDHWTVKHDGKTVHVHISPYSWMSTAKGETGYRLTLGKEYPNVGCEFFVIKKPYLSLEKADIDKPIKVWLDAGNMKRLEAAEAKWLEMRDAHKRDAAKSDDAEKKRDKAQADKGMKFKVIAVVEPKAGDDYTIEWYSETKPTPAEIAKVLKSKRSDSTDNYKIVKLGA